MAKVTQNMDKSPVLAAFGNPILDMCVVLKDDTILRKYRLQPDGQKEITEEEKIEIFQDVKKGYPIQYCAGGAALNTLRIFQWLVGTPHQSVFLGGIGGNDEQGKLLEELVKNSGVTTRYTYHQDYPTATCVALINGENRSLVAHLGAANVYEPSHLDVPETMEILRKVKMFYIEGFFITHSFPTALKLLQFCHSNGIGVVFNLSGVYVCEKYSYEVLELVKQANVVFGNINEFKMLKNALKWNCNTAFDIALTVAQINTPSGNTSKANEITQKLLNRGKIVVITQGKESVIWAHAEGHLVNEFKVPTIDKNLVKDSTGAGDAFVAGVLAGLFSEKDIEVCIECGCWTAQQIIQQIGCAIPDYSHSEIHML